jgi:hypothetical protein
VQKSQELEEVWVSRASSKVHATSDDDEAHFLVFAANVVFANVVHRAFSRACCPLCDGHLAELLIVKEAVYAFGATSCDRCSCDIAVASSLHRCEPCDYNTCLACFFKVSEQKTLIHVFSRAVLLMYISFARHIRRFWQSAHRNETHHNASQQQCWQTIVIPIELLI